MMTKNIGEEIDYESLEDGTLYEEKNNCKTWEDENENIGIGIGSSLFIICYWGTAWSLATSIETNDE